MHAVFTKIQTLTFSIELLFQRTTRRCPAGILVLQRPILLRAFVQLNAFFQGNIVIKLRRGEEINKYYTIGEKLGTCVLWLITIPMRGSNRGLEALHNHRTQPAYFNPIVVQFPKHLVFCGQSVS